MRYLDKLVEPRASGNSFQTLNEPLSDEEFENNSQLPDIDVTESVSDISVKSHNKKSIRQKKEDDIELRLLKAIETE